MLLLRKAAKILAVIALCAIAGLGILVAGLWIDHHQETTLVAPTGHFAVGRIMYDWHDPNQQELMAPHAGIPREIVAWIWYPASTQQSALPADYFPRSWRDAFDRQRGWLLTEFMWRDLSRVHSHSFESPPLAAEQQRYPVLLMRAGLAAEVASYTSLAEDLASHGYVVVGFDAPYRSTIVVFPDGRIIARTPRNNADLVSGVQQKQLATRLEEAWSADMSFALDRLQELDTSDPSGRLQGHLDLSRVGAFGHSLGGATALQFCHDDLRCRAGVDIDGAPLGTAVKDGIKPPFLFLMSDHRRESKSETVPVEEDVQSIYDRLPQNQRLWITLRGAGHFGFVDTAPLPLHVAHLLRIVPMTNKRQIEITRECLRTFFSVYLSDEPASRLQGLRVYSEVRISP